MICKQCGNDKLLCEFYKHPLTKEGVMHRCKVCVKNGRKTGHELSMARKRDKKRYMEKPERRKYIFESSKIRRKEKGYGHIHLKTSRWIKKLGLRPENCPICGNHKSISRIEAHHYDYNKRNEIIFCCSICHSKLDQKKIDPQNCMIVNIKPSF